MAATSFFVAASNSLTITSLSDLTCKKARLIDRQEGTFSKVLLDFIPVTTERFDLLMRQRDYFEPPIQALFEFSHSAAFIEQTAELGGYNKDSLGKVIFNM